MAKPVGYTFWRYWGCIAIKIPKLLLHSYKDWFASMNLILFLATLCNKQIADILRRHGQGISPWWSLVFIGIFLLWSVMVPIYERDKEVYLAYKDSDEKLEQLQDHNFISLKEACDIFHGEKVNIFGLTIADTYEELTPHVHYNNCARYFLGVATIYGNSPSPIFKGRRIISEDKFTLGEIKVEEGELILYGPGDYIGKTPEYVGLAIKKENLTQNIEKIISDMTIPLNDVIQELYADCQQVHLLNKFINIYIKEKYITRNEILNHLATRYAQLNVFPIYGQDILSNERRQIPKDVIINMQFDNEGSSLHSSFNEKPKYINLFIKRKDHDYAIALVKEEFKKMIQEADHEEV